jgi:proline dehydrogenase
MKALALKALLIASLRTADPVGTSRRVVAALAAKAPARSQMPDEDVQLVREAFAKDMQLWEAIQTSDPVAMRAGLRKLSRRMGEFTRGTALGEAMAILNADALVAGMQFGDSRK